MRRRCANRAPTCGEVHRLAVQASCLGKHPQTFAVAMERWCYDEPRWSLGELLTAPQLAHLLAETENLSHCVDSVLAHRFRCKVLERPFLFWSCDLISSAACSTTGPKPLRSNVKGGHRRVLFLLSLCFPSPHLLRSTCDSAAFCMTHVHHQARAKMTDTPPTWLPSA